MATKRETEFIEWFENTDLGDDILEAKRNGTLIVTKAGENPLEAAIKRRQAEKNKVHVGMRLPSIVVDKVKKRAAVAGIPWTSYVCAILEQAVSEPQTQPAQPRTV